MVAIGAPIVVDARDYFPVTAPALIMVGVLFWAARSGQYDDLESPAWRILMDDDRRPPGADVEDDPESPGREPRS